MVEGHKSVMDDEEFQEQMSNKILDKMIDGKTALAFTLHVAHLGAHPWSRAPSLS